MGGKKTRRIDNWIGALKSGAIIYIKKSVQFCAFEVVDNYNWIIFVGERVVKNKKKRWNWLDKGDINCYNYSTIFIFICLFYPQMFLYV